MGNEVAPSEYDLWRKVGQLNNLFAEIQSYKREHPEQRGGYYEQSLGSILNAYREGDLEFDEAIVAIGNTRASTSSPLTAEQAKERAREMVQTWRARWKSQSYSLARDTEAENDIVDRIASELRAVAPSVDEASALAASVLPTGVHNALHAAREALERHFTPTGITDHAYIQDALKAVNRELKLERAAPSTPSSAAELARRIAEKIADAVGFDVDVQVDTNGTRIAAIIESELTTFPSTDTSQRIAKAIVDRYHVTTRVGGTLKAGEVEAVMAVVESELSATPVETEKRGREMFAAELLNQLDRITNTTAAFHLVKSLCLIEVGRDPNTLGVEIEEATNSNDPVSA